MNAQLRITDIERITLHVPFRDRVQPWNNQLVWKWGIVEVTRVETDAGIVGYGETLPHYTWGVVTDEAVERVRGKNVFDCLADDSLGCGLQMAMYDAAGKATGVPAHHLFGLPQVRDHCPIAWWNTKMSPEDLAHEARDAVAEGYTAHKFKVRPWIDIYAQVEAVSDVTPEGYLLDLDWNGFLVNAGNAKRVLAELDGYEKVAIYESPIPHEDVEGYRQLRNHTNRPIAMHFMPPPMHFETQREMVDGFVVHNGIVSILQKGMQAAAFNKPFWLQIVGPGLTTAWCAQIGAVMSHAQWPAITCLNNYSEDLLVDPIEIAGGYMRVPSGPGLGVEFDESAIDRFRMEPPYDLPEPRHIITVKWPNGRSVHFARMQRCWDEFKLGHLPVQERGVVTTVQPDDGTPEWSALFDRALESPVYDVHSA